MTIVKRQNSYLINNRSQKYLRINMDFPKETLSNLPSAIASFIVHTTVLKCLEESKK